MNFCFYDLMNQQVAKFVNSSHQNSLVMESKTQISNTAIETLQQDSIAAAPSNYSNHTSWLTRYYNKIVKKINLTLSVTTDVNCCSTCKGIGKIVATMMCCNKVAPMKAFLPSRVNNIYHSYLGATGTMVTCYWAHCDIIRIRW